MGWRIYIFYIFLGDRSNLKKYYFQIVLSKLGKRYFFSVAQRSKLDFKIDTFWQVDTRILNMLQIKNPFSGLFQSCFGVVKEIFGKGLFLGIKRPTIYMSFQLYRFIHDLENWYFWSNFDPLFCEGYSWPFGDKKSRFLDFKIIFELLWECLAVVFCLKKSTFGCIFI